MGSCCAHKKAAGEPMPEPEHKHDHRHAAPLPAESFQDKLKLYRPIWVILGLSVLGAAALHVAGRPFEPALMGFFLLQLAALKLFDLDGFAMGFARYDLLAKKSAVYARTYPFVELGLGLFYLAGVWPLLTNALMMAVGLLGAAGVWQVIQKGQAFTCACVGTGFNLPVGRVTLAEDLGMAAMAALMLAQM